MQSSLSFYFFPLFFLSFFQRVFVPTNKDQKTKDRQPTSKLLPRLIPFGSELFPNQVVVSSVRLLLRSFQRSIRIRGMEITSASWILIARNDCRWTRVFVRGASSRDKFRIFAFCDFILFEACSTNVEQLKFEHSEDVFITRRSWRFRRNLSKLVQFFFSPFYCILIYLRRKFLNFPYFATVQNNLRIQRSMIRDFRFSSRLNGTRERTRTRAACRVMAHRFGKCIRVSGRETAAPWWLVEMPRPVLE